MPLLMPTSTRDFELALRLATERACRIADRSLRQERLLHLLDARGHARLHGEIPFDARAVAALLEA